MLDDADPRMQCLGRIAREHGHRLLREHRARVDALVDEVNRRPRLGRRPPRERPRRRAAPGNAGSSAGCTFTTLPGKRERKTGRRRCMYPAQTTSSTSCAASQSAMAASRLVAIRRTRRERTPRWALRPRRPARARRTPATFEATAAIGIPASIRAWRFEPAPADEHADSEPPSVMPTRLRSRRRSARSRGRQRRTSVAGMTAQYPIPMLKTRRSSSSATPLSASHWKTSGRSQDDGSIDRAETVRAEHAAEIPGDSAARDVSEPAHVGPRAQAREHRRDRAVSAAGGGRRQTLRRPTILRTSENPFA